MSSKLEEIEREMARRAAERRPTMDLAYETVADSMAKLPGGGARPEVATQDFWSWVDRHGKVYALSPSPEHDGHPMLTIRQPISTGLGAWLTTTALLIGPDRGTILNSITMLVVSHLGSHSGYESTIKETSRGGVEAGLAHACRLVGRDPTVNSMIAKAIRDSDKDRDPGDAN